MHLVAQITLSNQSAQLSKEAAVARQQVLQEQLEQRPTGSACPASLAAQHFSKASGSPAMALDASSSSFVFMIPGVMGANAPPLPPRTASQPKQELLSCTTTSAASQSESFYREPKTGCLRWWSAPTQNQVMQHFPVVRLCVRTEKKRLNLSAPA